MPLKRICYTPADVALILGITKDEVIARCERGQIRHIIIGGKYSALYRIPLDAVPAPPPGLLPDLTLDEPRPVDEKPDILRYRGQEENIFSTLHREQGSTCAICGKVQTKRRRLVVDHDHKSGYVRGLLCTPCNNALGQFQDSPELLRRAAQYIEENPIIGRRYTYTEATYDRMRVTKPQRRRKRDTTPAA